VVVVVVMTTMMTMIIIIIVVILFDVSSRMDHLVKHLTCCLLSYDRNLGGDSFVEVLVVCWHSVMQ
jgi:hypothetical protein